MTPYPYTPAIPYEQVPPVSDDEIQYLSAGQYFSPPYYKLSNPDIIFQAWVKKRSDALRGFSETADVYAPDDNPPPTPSRILPATWDDFCAYCRLVYLSNPWNIGFDVVPWLPDITTTIDLPVPAPWMVSSNSYRTFHHPSDSPYYTTIDRGPEYIGNHIYRYWYSYHWGARYFTLPTLTANRAAFPDPRHSHPGIVAPLTAIGLLGSLLFVAGATQPSPAPGRRRPTQKSG